MRNGDERSLAEARIQATEVVLSRSARGRHGHVRVPCQFEESIPNQYALPRQESHEWVEFRIVPIAFADSVFIALPAYRPKKDVEGRAIGKIVVIDDNGRQTGIEDIQGMANQGGDQYHVNTTFPDDFIQGAPVFQMSHHSRLDL